MDQKLPPLAGFKCKRVLAKSVRKRIRFIAVAPAVTPSRPAGAAASSESIVLRSDVLVEGHSAELLQHWVRLNLIEIGIVREADDVAESMP